MRSRIAIAIGVAAGLLLATWGSSPSLTVQADTMLQEVPRLEGYRIYFSESGSEASRFDRSEQGLSRFAGLLQRLGAQLTTLEWSKDIPADANLVIIAGPTSDLRADQSARLWSYLNNNGRLLLLADPLVLDTRNNSYSMNRALPSTSGFFELTWADLGIRARSDVVVTEGDLRRVIPGGDSVRAETPTPTPLPAVEAPILIREFVTSNLDTNHPIVAGIEGPLAFFGVRSIEFDASIQSFETTPLVFSDSIFYGESDYGGYLGDGVSEYNIGSDTTRGPLALIASVEDPEAGTRIVIIGDRDFATNGGGLQTSPSYTAGFVYPENVRFLLSSVAWLLEADPANRVELVFPTPGPTATPTTTPSPVPSATVESGG